MLRIVTHDAMLNRQYTPFEEHDVLKHAHAKPWAWHTREDLSESLRMDANRTPRVALVHDWLNGMRGGEKCLEVFCHRWPDAALYTLLHKPGSVSADIER